jgi:hypothetical protein
VGAVAGKERHEHGERDGEEDVGPKLDEREDGPGQDQERAETHPLLHGQRLPADEQEEQDDPRIADIEGGPKHQRREVGYVGRGAQRHRALARHPQREVVDQRHRQGSHQAVGQLGNEGGSPEEIVQGADDVVVGLRRGFEQLGGVDDRVASPVVR